MDFLKWQKEILSQTDLEIFEIITVRHAGKTTLSLAWLSEDADISILINKHAKSIRNELKEKIKELGLKPKEFHVVANLEQLRQLNISSNRKVKIVVDEYFQQPDISLNALDKRVGHEKYKVMFIGSRTKKEDKFKIPFSKQYTVDLVKLFGDGALNRNQVDMILASYGPEELELDFGTPFETN